MDDYDRRLTQAQDWAAEWQRRALSAEAERDRLRESARLATNAADAAAEAVGNMAEKCSALLAERDRLRAAVMNWLNAVVCADGSAQAALNHLGAVVGWQPDRSAEATDG